MRTAVATLALANLARQTDRVPRPARPGSRLSPGMDPSRKTTVHRSRSPVLAEARRFARFLVVGLGGTAIDFVWNRRWTFDDAGRAPGPDPAGRAFRTPRRTGGPQEGR